MLPQFIARVGSANPFDKVKSDENVAPRLVDLDADGLLDLVVGEATKGLTFYENRQQGTTFAAPLFYEFAGAASPLGFVEVDIRGSGESFSAPTLVDLDGDGDLDVVVGHSMGYDTDENDELSADERRVLVSTDTLFFYENIGSAEVPEFVQRTGSENPFAYVDAWGYSSATLGDLDADGDLDLVLGDEQGELHYYEHVKSTATPFVARLAWANPLKLQFDDISSITSAFGDLDNDGDMDVIFAVDWDMFYLENIGTSFLPSFQVKAGFFTDLKGKGAGDTGPALQPGASALVDLDGDGDLDLIVGSCVCVDDSTTTGLYDAECSWFNPSDDDDPSDDDSTGCGDWDDADFTASEQCCACGGGTSVGLAYYENNGTANASQFVARTGTLNPFDGLDMGGGAYCKPVFVDVDNDSDHDLVLGDTSGALKYFENNGTAAAPHFIARVGGANPFASVDVHARSAPALIDYDNDGDLDLAVGGANGTIVYYENTGTPELPEYNAGVSPFADVDVYANSAPAFCDLDGDDKVDLLVGGSKIHPDEYAGGLPGFFNGGFYYYENTGSVAPEFVARTGRADPLPFQIDDSISRPTLGDLDGDGAPPQRPPRNFGTISILPSQVIWT